jgi:flavin reductase (DIM6/NTAB) family NADH-FMN oxidoreductase RutF
MRPAQQLPDSEGEAMQEAFEDIAATLDPALIIVTTALDGERAGCLVGFHAQSSMDPQRYCVWLSKANHTARVAQRADYQVVHPAPEDDYALAKRFGTLTGDETDKFEGLELTDGPGGVPLLAGCPAGFVLRKLTVVDEGGDHICITGAVIDSWSTGSLRPLRLSRARDLDPGHGNEERPLPPTERAP